MADASLVILLTAKDEMSHVLSGAGKEAEGFGNKLKGAAVAVGAFATGFLSFRALEGALDATKELGSEVRQLSRETGLGAEDASRFIFVLKELGLSGDTASKPMGILAKNVVNTRDAMLEGKDATSPFANSMKVLGISFVQANGQVKPTNDLLLQLADRFKAMPDGAEKTARAIDIFGRSGKDMLPILNLGAEGIRELGAEADKLGVTLSADNVEKIRLYQRAQRELNEALLGIKVTIATAIIPTLTGFANWFTEHQNDVRQFVQDAIQAVGKMASDFKAGFDTIKEGLGYIPDHKGEIAAAIAFLGTALVLALGPTSAAFLAVAGIVALIGKIKTEGLDLGPLGSIGGIKNPLNDQLRDLYKQKESLQSEIDRQQKQPLDYSYQNIPKLNDTQSRIDRIEALTPNVDIRRFGSIEDAEAWAAAVKKSGEAAKDSTPPIADVGVNLDALAPPAKKAADATRTLGEVLNGAVSKLGAAASALFSRPTREQAQTQLQLDRTQLAFDQLTQRMEPLKFGLQVLKDAVDADQRAFNLHRLAMSDEADALSDQAAELDKKIRDQQRADAGSSGGGGTVLGLVGGSPGAGTLGRQAPGITTSGAGGGGGGALEALQKQREDVADQQQALQRKMRDEEKAFQKEQLQKQEFIRQQQEIYDKTIEQSQRKLDAIRQDQTVASDYRRILQDQLTLADKTLLTDQKQNELAVELIAKTSDFTGKIKEAADAAHVTLVPGLDDAFNAASGLATELRNNTMTAFQDTAGVVRDLAGAIAPLLSLLRNVPTLPNSTPPLDAGTGAGLGGLGR